MKRLLAIFLLLSAFVLPMITACVPSGYESGNPNRPADNQVNVEGLPQGDNPPADQPATQPETQPDASGGGDESGE
jgi:hypothetical protein